MLPTLDETLLDAVRRRGREVTIPAHWCLVVEQQPADEAYVLLSGRVDVRHRGRVLAELGPGDLVGEVGLVDRRLRTATVTTLEPVSALAIPAGDFARLRHDHPQFDAWVRDVTTDRLRDPAGGTVDTVVLDVDGTLVDSLYQHVEAWAAAFDGIGVVVPRWRIHRAIGMGGDRLVGAVAGEETELAHGDAVRAAHDEGFAALEHTVRALPGAADLVAALSDRDVRVVLASSGQDEQTERLMRLVGGVDRLDAWSTGSEELDTKPAPDLVEAAVRRAGGTRAVVVGDAVWDFVAARQRGDHGIGLLTGGFGADELLEAGAEQVYRDPADLLAHLDETAVDGLSAR